MSISLVGRDPPRALKPTARLSIRNSRSAELSVSETLSVMRTALWNLSFFLKAFPKRVSRRTRWISQNMVIPLAHL